MTARRGLAGRLLFVLVVALVTAVCGKKGPPLAPLRLVPEAPASVSVVRMASQATLRFVVPATYGAGVLGPVDIDRVEIYAVSLAPGAVPPPNRDLLTLKYLVGSVPVRPIPLQDEPPPQAAATDARPGPGEAARFVEELTREMLNPAPPVTPSAPVVVVTPGQVPSIPIADDVLVPRRPVRIYTARAVTRRGVAGNPSARVQLPLVPPPPPVTDVRATFSATSLALSWTPPAIESAASLLYNVYRADAPAGPPLTPKPVAERTFELPGVEYGVEQCFIVRAVEMAAGVAIESEVPAQPTCVTPRDIFPPAAPAGLSGVSSGGVVALIWDPNTEPDLAGYLVLRAEAPGETLRAVTPVPITETVYRDTAVTPGVRYVYAIVAVDTATPPNISAQSTRFEVTAAQ